MTCRDGVCRWVLAAACLVFAAAGAEAAGRYDPRLQFRTITTPHFVIHFHQGEDELARRLAALAEETHEALTARFPSRTRGRTQVILVDQADLSNGWATPFPYNTIEITAAPPPGESLIGNTNDWLRLVFTHEYTHILHLDRSTGWVPALRAVFGRAPIVFPNAYLPQWQVEGIATFYESAVTGEGRVPAGDFANIFRQAARSRRLEPLDRVNGGLVDWPSGNAAYVYGAYFHEFLAKRYGEAALTRLANETASLAPWTGSAAFRMVFRRSLGALWADFKKQADAETQAAVPGLASPRRLTRHGFIVAGPRWDAGSNHRVLYSMRNPHGFPALMTVSLDGAAPRKLTSQFFGERVAVNSGALFFDQMEWTRNTALHSDLYVADRVGDERGGLRIRRVRRLTHGSRAIEPDIAPDGRSIVCALLEPGRRALATLQLGARPRAQPVVLLSEPETIFAAPRWSPDGRLIAVERRRLRGASEIVLVEPQSRQVRVLVSSRTARNVTPTWTPDGRTVIFASSRADAPFDLFAVEVESGTLSRLPAAAGGARAPDVSPDGRMIAFIGYTSDGYDVFTVPLDRATWEPVPGPREESAELPGASSADPGQVAAVRSYSPWPTILPRYWVPEFIIEDDTFKIGGSTSGLDALARHRYYASVLADTTGGRPDWIFSYSYDRWLPTFFFEASSEFTRLADDRLREDTAEFGIALRDRRARHSQVWAASLQWERDVLTCARGTNGDLCSSGSRSAPNRNAFRLGWIFDGAKQYGYSVSPQDGVTVGFASEHVRSALGADGDADSFIGEVRGYVALGSRHSILAARAAAGTASGDDAVRRVFTLGGSGPIGLSPGVGTNSLALMRGFGSGEIVGTHAALVNIDYRWPLVRIERGHGTWPFFLRWLHGAVFVDAGNAWTHRFASRDLKSSIGGELSLDAVLSYYAPLTLAFGAAWKHDGSRPGDDGRGFYFRVGRAF